MVKTIYQKNGGIKINYLFWFLAAWSTVQFSMCLIEFIQLDAFQVPAYMPFAYFLLILIYVLKKEVHRWLKRSWKKQKGEFFLIGWWLAAACCSAGWYTPWSCWGWACQRRAGCSRHCGAG